MTNEVYCADCGIIKKKGDKFALLSKGGRVCEPCADIRRAAIPQEDENLKMLKKINDKLAFFVLMFVLGFIVLFFGTCGF